MAIAIHIVANHPLPIYQQIVGQVRHAIAAGRCGEGEALPSVRGLAEMLVVNPNTVARAYRELVREGLVKGSPGRALVVAGKLPGYSKGVREEKLEGPVEALVHEAVGMRVKLKELVELVEESYRRHEAATNAATRQETR